MRRNLLSGLTAAAVMAAVGLAQLIVPVAPAGATVCPNEALRMVQHAAGLGDCRAFELVSAVDKNGGDVMGDPTRVRVADDGGAAAYASLSEFGDSAGGGIATEYMAVRSPGVDGQGWVTHGILPEQPALPFQAVTSGFEARYEQDLSPDLDKGVLFSWSPLTEDPLVANVANLYLRDDLRTPGGGNYSLVTGCPLCIGPIPLEKQWADPIMVASTPNLDHVLFESELDLAPGASGGSMKLYEWDAASQEVSLAGVLPNGEGALDSAAGTGHGRWEHRHAISEDGSKVFFVAAPAGVQNLYIRLNGTSTVQLNVPEVTEGAPGIPASATFGDASVDGSRVFFTTTERLTNDAPTDGSSKLYMYDTTKPDHNLTFLSPGLGPNGVDGVVGASADGSTVYFSDSVQILPGLPPLKYTKGMFVWHEGQVSFVAGIPGEDQLLLTETALGKSARVSPSGDLAFLSDEPTAFNPEGVCPPSGTHACDMLYVYSIASHRLSCASCNRSGAPATAGVLGVFNVGVGGSAVSGHLNRFLTDDGQKVFFTTTDALVPEDVNGKYDVYEYDVATEKVSLVSSGVGTSDSYFMETTPSGNDAYFTTQQRLVGWDRDSNYDLYDARVNGGFPEPTLEPPPCASGDCRSLPSAPPVFDPPASNTLNGTANLPAPALVTKGLTTAQKLSSALKVCKKKHARSQRKRCETQARKRYAKKTIKRGSAK